jgi:predicted DNA-binding transcriptional regulator YafY
MSIFAPLNGVNMKQIERIAKMIQYIKKDRLSAEEIKALCTLPGNSISIRQIQRDLKDLKLFLNEEEYIHQTKENKKVYYSIFKKRNDYNQFTKENSIFLNSGFFHQIDTEELQKNIKNIELAILNKKQIIIQSIKNDETGDNSEFVSESFRFYPINIIHHRNTNYVGGWNPKKKRAQIFGTNQLQQISIQNETFAHHKYKALFEEEYQKRFGVTKNINQEVYNIKLELSHVLYGFLSSHHWHDSQKFTRKNNNVIMHLNCGINRELLGWLFLWMYNIRVIEPPILDEYYQRTIDEIQKNRASKKILVYRNIFEEK